jgi:hypothetical protein
VAVGPDLIKRLKTERVETRRPVNHIVEQAVARYYETEPPIITG